MSNYKLAVVAIIEHNGQILLGKKNATPGHFLSEVWHIPGGKVEENETEEEGLIREMEEETGLEIKIEKFIAEKIDSSHNFRVRWYLCSPVTHTLNPSSDLIEVKFVPKEEVLKICSPRAYSLWPEEVIEYFKK